VATLDAADARGALYPAMDEFRVGDVLTSQPIRLDYPADDGVVLSFFYQAQGVVDAPEVRDSLVLEFFNRQTQLWDKVWSAPGSPVADFQQVLLSVGETFLTDSFVFRFKNIVSLTADGQNSRVGNADFWHLDYVRLDRGRDAFDPSLPDIALVEAPRSLLADYEAVPWAHFRENPQALAPSVGMAFANNDSQERLVDQRNFTLTDLMGEAQAQELAGGSQNILPGQTARFDPNHSFSILGNSADSALFELKAEIRTDEFDYAPNNAASYHQRFFNYYAYDDGSAEYSYGITGEGTRNAQLAYRFDLLREDTLRGVQMCFNQTYLDASRSFFILTIWTDNAGLPADTLYTQIGLRPQYDGPNGYISYPLDSALVLSGTVYIGWEQTTTEFLALGADANRPTQGKIFYNTNGSWRPSSFDIALMIRPMFGHPIRQELVSAPAVEREGPRVWPNPSDGRVSIQGQGFEQAGFVLMSLAGQAVASGQARDGAIDLGAPAPGLYLLLVKAPDGRQSWTRLAIHP